MPARTKKKRITKTDTPATTTTKPVKYLKQKQDKQTSSKRPCSKAAQLWLRSLKIARDPFIRQRRARRATALKNNAAILIGNNVQLTPAQKDHQIVSNIHYYQSSTRDLVPFPAFRDVLREILADYRPDFRFRVGAMAILRTAAEREIVDRFQNGGRIMVHDGQQKLQIEHLHQSDRIRPPPYLQTMVWTRERTRRQAEMQLIANQSQ